MKASCPECQRAGPRRSVRILQKTGDGTWIRKDGPRHNVTTSDGHGTGFSAYLIRSAGLSSTDDDRIRKAVARLKTLQHPSGCWYTRPPKRPQATAQHKEEAKRMATVLWPRVDRTMRSLHLYTGLFLSPWMLVYATSAFCLNHDAWVRELFHVVPPSWELVREVPFVPAESFPVAPDDQASANPAEARFGRAAPHSGGTCDSTIDYYSPVRRRQLPDYLAPRAIGGCD